MKYIHTSYCGKPLQLGFGLPTYKGVQYQDGYGVYRGQGYQRGYGLGSFLRKTANAAATKVKTVAKNIGRAALPAVKRVGKAAAKQAMEQALAAGMNKKKLKKSAIDLGKTTLDNAIKEAKGVVRSQTGLGGRRGVSRKRKRSDLVFTPCKKARKTVFD